MKNKALIGFVVDCCDEHANIAMRNTSQPCGIKMRKSAKWKLSRSDSIGAAVYLSGRKTVRHF